MPSIESKLWSLVKRLAENTSAGSRDWEVTPSPKAFQTSFPEYSVRIVETESLESPEPDYMITLYDKDGRLIERATDSQLSQAAADENENAFVVMRDLYTEARRKSLGVEQAIDNVIASLEDDIPF